MISHPRPLSTLLFVLALSGCKVELAVPDGAMILCARTDECPADWVCVETLGRCIRADDPDRQGPALVDVSVQPALATTGTAVRLTLDLDEALERAPLIDATAPGSSTPVRLTATPVEPTRWAAAFVVDDGTVEGDWTLTASVLDTRGNPATLDLGGFTVDRTPPVVSEVAFDRTVATSNTLTRLAAVFNETVTLEAITLLDARNQTVAVLDADGAVSNLPQGGASLALELALETLDLQHGDALTFELDARDLAGNATRTRSPALVIDDEAPVLIAFTTPDGQSVGTRDVTLAIETIGATWMRLTGDVLPTVATFDWVPYASSTQVTLTSGGTKKTLAVTLRDEAGNESPVSTLELTVLDGPTRSAPLLVAADGQGAVKNGDLLTIGGSGDAGATVVSARVVRASDGQTIQALDATTVTIDRNGALSGSFPLSGAAHGDLIALEVVLTVRGRASLPASSRSPALTVDLLPPAPLDPTKVVLFEHDGAPLNPGLEDAFHRFELTGLDGATVDARQVRIYGDLAQAPLVQVSTSAAGGFEAVDVPFVPAQRYLLTTVDHAGNESAAVTVSVPRATGVVVMPRPARAGTPVKVLFTTNMRLRAPPEVTIDGKAAACADGDIDKVGGDTFACDYTPDGSEQEGPDAAVVRIELAPSTALLASPSMGFDASTASFDFTPPVLGELQVQHSPPGTPDRVTGPAGTVTDTAGADPLSLSAWPVTLEVLGADGELYGAGRVNPDGSFTLDAGDNATDAFSVRARDAAGNETVSPLLLNDHAPPVLVSLTVTPEAQRSGEPVTVTLRLRDDAELAAPTITLPRGDATLLDRANDAGELVFTYEYTPREDLDAEGINTFEVVAVDPGGNTATAQGSVRFDFTPPVSAPTTPGGQAVWNGNPSILGRASDEATGISQVLLSVRDTDSDQWFDGTDFTSSEEVLLPAVGTTAFSAESFPFVDARTYEIHSRAIDGAGNTQPQPGVATFTFDEDSLDGPLEPEAHSIGSGSVLVRWQAPAAATVESYRVYYADVDSPGPPWSDDGALEGPSPITTTDTELLLTELPSKRYGIVVTAVHAGGVESPFSARVEVDSNVWRWRNPALTSATFSAVVAVDDQSFVVVGGNGRIMRSTDAGASWQFAKSSVSGDFRHLTNRGPIIIAAHDGGLLRSSDAGLTWTSVGPNVSFLGVASGSNAPCPEAPEPCVFHAITQSNVYRSVDGGLTWASKATGTNLHTLSASGAKVIVGTFATNVIVSADEGATFKSSAAFPANHVAQKVYTDGDRWYASASNPQVSGQWITRYSTTGTDWATSATLPQTEMPQGWLRVDDSLLVVTSGGIHQSTNGGVSYARLLSSTRLGTLCRGLESTVAVGQTLFRSTNLTSWTMTDPELNAGLRQCVAAGGVVVAIGNASLWRSVDDGASWLRVQAITVHQLNVVHRSGQRAFTAGNGVAYASDDGGKTWSPASVGPYSLTTFAADGDTWVVAGAGAIYRSGDAGVTWSAATGTGSLDYHHVFGHEGTFIAGGSEGLRRSTDGGKIWKSVHTTLWPVRSVWGAGGTWIAAGESLLVISEDDGQTWSNADGDTNWNFRSVSGYGETLIAGADGGRVRYRLDASSGWQTASVSREPGYVDLNFKVNELSVAGWHTPDGIRWVGVSSNGTVRTTNLADGFIARGGPVTVYPHALPVTIAGNAEFVAISTTDSVYYSRDLGASWQTGTAATPLGFSRPNALWVGDDGKALAAGSFSMIVSLDLP